ncbi:hypothetical protein MKW94_026862 [Papaver nudicaule]|uniref:Uncharacterized protein n=1 Tax=Papaver nudicaule TaxID=74823 RepID=A0AA41VD30_PAPNU|nr:hypothetical protein [Papaver nudicaule]
METLVIAQHRSQYYGGGSRSHQGGSSMSPSSSGCFKGINCRTYHQSGGSGGGAGGGSAGILPTPPPIKSYNPDYYQSVSPPKTPKSVKKPNFDEGTTKFCSSSSPPITISCIKDRNFCREDFTCCSELWAGPAYSNSPPPSSLPLPKFSLRPKRSVSLPVTSSDEKIVDMIHQFAKSAPPSPTRESADNKNDIFESIDFATKDLCRILNLDIAGKTD